MPPGTSFVDPDEEQIGLDFVLTSVRSLRHLPGLDDATLARPEFSRNNGDLSHLQIFPAPSGFMTMPTRKKVETFAALYEEAYTTAPRRWASRISRWIDLIQFFLDIMIITFPLAVLQVEAPSMSVKSPRHAAWWVWVWSFGTSHRLLAARAYISVQDELKRQIVCAKKACRVLSALEHPFLFRQSDPSSLFYEETNVFRGMCLELAALFVISDCLVLMRPQQKVEAITRACGILFGIRYAAFTLYKSNPGTLESYTAVQLRTSEALPFLLNQLDALSSKQNQSSILALPPYITALHAIESILCEYPDGCSESYVAWEDPRIILVFGILMYNSASLEWQTALQTLDVVAHSVRCTQAMLRHLRTVRDNTAKGTYSKIRTVVLISWKHMLMNARSRNDKAIIAQTIAGGVVFCLEQLSVSTDTEDSEPIIGLGIMMVMDAGSDSLPTLAAQLSLVQRRLNQFRENSIISKQWMLILDGLAEFRSADFDLQLMSEIRSNPKVFCSLVGCSSVQFARSRCSGCGVRHYCSQKCQQMDWKQHKKVCSSLGEARRKEEQAVPIQEGLD